VVKAPAANIVELCEPVGNNNCISAKTIAEQMIRKYFE
jgi:hypothetical protein